MRNNASHCISSLFRQAQEEIRQGLMLYGSLTLTLLKKKKKKQQQKRHYPKVEDI